MSWSSDGTFAIPQDFSDIVFLGTRKVVADEPLRARLNLGPANTYATRFVFKRTWALSGVYAGPGGGSPGDLVLYRARGK